MNRVKRHKIKREKAETSSAFTKIAEEHDLAYYIHDRVELMHQVFSVLKTKDIKAMSPECVRRLSIDDLQELCTEELLGISSKRLLAILDGAEPPSDTESSSQSSEHLEAISLDSISSDEEILSVGSKKHKHKRRNSKSKKQKKHKKATEAPEEDKEQSKASRAGLTVLELLELQARARAIRAQLQQEQSKRSSEQVEVTAVESSQQSSDSEVEIKDEPTEVVVLSSSEDEKPNVKELEKTAAVSNSKTVEKDVANVSKPTTSTEKDDINHTTTNNSKHKESGKTKKKKEKSKKKDKDKERRKKNATSNRESGKNKDPSPVKELTVEEPRKETECTDQVNRIDQIEAAENSNKITKRVSDLIITVPQHSSRKIKLNRMKTIASISNAAEESVTVENMRPSSVVTIPEKATESIKKVCSVVSRPKAQHNNAKITTDQNNMSDGNTDQSKTESEVAKSKDKPKKKTKKKEKRQSIDEDHDEITLQLSDTEKMDLLEDFDRKDYERVSSSSSDSESSSSDSSDASTKKSVDNSKCTIIQHNIEEASQGALENKHVDEGIHITNKNEEVLETDSASYTEIMVTEKEHTKVVHSETQITVSEKDHTEEPIVVPSKHAEASALSLEYTQNIQIYTEDQVSDVNQPSILENTCLTTSQHKNSCLSAENEKVQQIEVFQIQDIPVLNNEDPEPEQNPFVEKQIKIQENPDIDKYNLQANKEKDKQSVIDSLPVALNEDDKESRESSEDGEVSDAESSEVEALEVQQEVVCISDDETPKKKKKKDKKCKKEKIKKTNFRESSNENFYKDTNNPSDMKVAEFKTINLDDDDDDVFEILELSDDSSCYEVEGITLSKEPTDEEIAALSAKIDEIGDVDRLPIITEQEIQKHEQLQAEKVENSESNENIEHVSWKDRYLNSNKVKKVLTTSNILNALRKKNKELKKKIEESKKNEIKAVLQKRKELEEEKNQEARVEKILEEGSIEQYNTLQGSTKYVDPVPDPVEEAKKKAEEVQQQEEELKQEALEKEAQAIKEQEQNVQKAIESQVTGEMKKDAKLLLKMYKKLFQYNDITKIKKKDPKQKKHKKKKKKEKVVAATSANVV